MRWDNLSLRGPYHGNHGTQDSGVILVIRSGTLSQNALLPHTCDKLPLSLFHLSRLLRPVPIPSAPLRRPPPLRWVLRRLRILVLLELLVGQLLETFNRQFEKFEKSEAVQYPARRRRTAQGSRQGGNWMQ